MNNFAVWRKQSNKNARVDDMERFFSMTTLDQSHCKHDENGYSGTRQEDSSISALLFGPCPIGLPPLPLSLFHNLRGVSFNIDAELHNWLKIFTAKPADFFKREIENLPERWEAVVNNGGEYTIN
jgi:hypothetical protein